MEFLYAFGHRVMSGYQSYFGYSKRKFGLIIATAALAVYPAVTIWVTDENIPVWLIVVVCVYNAAVAEFKKLCFDDEYEWFRHKDLKKFKDIHLWESMLTGGFVIALILFGYNMLLIACSVYPALIIHKGLINLGSKLSFFSKVTDDPTGKTYSIPILKIKIRRSSTKLRLILAAVSIVLAVVVLLLHLDVSVSLFS